MPVWYTIDELNGYHTGSATDSRWQDWTASDWTLVENRFAVFMARHFPTATSANDSLFDGMSNDLVSFYTERATDLA